MNSLTLYASTEPTDPKTRYVQLVTTIFYELVTQKNSPLLSALCHVNQINFAPKNFRLEPLQADFAVPTSVDLFLLLYGLNVAAEENLSSVCKVFDEHAGKQFPTEALPEMCDFCLSALDNGLAKFTADDSHVLKTLADERHASDEKIITEIKSLQLSLQDELRTIAQIRDGLDFAAQREPIRQLIELFDKLNEISQRHPLPDTQKGYGELVRRCQSLLRYVKQSLAMLGAQFVSEVNVPVNLNLHETPPDSRPTDRATVSKILRAGFVYKGQVIRRAQVEFVDGGDAS